MIAGKDLNAFLVVHDSCSTRMCGECLSRNFFTSARSLWSLKRPRTLTVMMIKEAIVARLYRSSTACVSEVASATGSEPSRRSTRSVSLIEFVGNLWIFRKFGIKDVRAWRLFEIVGSLGFSRKFGIKDVSAWRKVRMCFGFEEEGILLCSRWGCG